MFQKCFVMYTQFYESARGHKKLTHNGYSFFKNSQHGKSLYWICDHYHKTNCRVRKVSVDNAIVKSVGEHNHLPSTPSLDFRFPTKFQQFSRDAPRSIMPQPLGARGFPSEFLRMPNVSESFGSAGPKKLSVPPPPPNSGQLDFQRQFQVTFSNGEYFCHLTLYCKDLVFHAAEFLNILEVL